MISGLRKLTRTGHVLEAKKAAHRLLWPPPSWHARDQRDIELIQALISWTLGPSDNAIDVGAHNGKFLADMVRVAPKGHHIAVEAIPQLAQALTERFPSTCVVNAAASNEAGEAIFNHVTNYPALSGMRLQPWERELESVTIAVPAVTLDSLVDDKAGTRLIKIDVEGAELLVLRGATEILEVAKPTVVFEFAKRTADVYGTTAQMVHSHLGDLEYRLFDIEGNGPLSVEQFEEIVAGGQVWNFVAH